MNDDRDARAFTPLAGALIVALAQDADEPIALQLQHMPRRRARVGVCGAVGQLAGSATSVTCPKCRSVLARRAKSGAT
jgi:hypothetical protein